MNSASSDAETFLQIIRRVRAGDQQAITELVRTYEPQIRRAVRVRLTDPRLRQVVDTMDICQSIMANFLVRVAAGQFQVETPEQLLNLLATMARNKLLDWVRKEQAGRRDQRRNVPLDTITDEQLGRAGAEPDPADSATGKNLIEEFRSRLTPRERQIVERRAQGLKWNEIAAQLDDNADALRVRFFRAISRVRQEMGIEPDTEDLP